MSEKDTKITLSKNTVSENSAEPKTDVGKLTEDFKVRNISSDKLIKSENAADTVFSLRAKDKDFLIAESTDSQLNNIEFSDNEIEGLLEKSVAFKELAEPKLPALPKENRARLQMQSPTRIYFYWSIKNSPFQTLYRIFGGNAGNYTLVAKLINRARGSDEIVPIEDEGAAWFEVDADSSYCAEIGFYAAHRPFVRLIFSNTIETPRSGPSARSDFSSDWTVSANEFARVLDASGYAHDAVGVALAGDDLEFAEKATRSAFSQIVGEDKENKDDLVFTAAAEMRFALLALAAGYTAESLRGQISKSLFAILQENLVNLSAEKALKALQENFGEFTDETIEEIEPTVFGASSINFPRFSKRRDLPKFAPISSLR